MKNTHWHEMPYDECLALAYRVARVLWYRHGKWCDQSDYEHEALLGLTRAITAFSTCDGPPKGTFRDYIERYVKYAVRTYRRQGFGEIKPTIRHANGNRLGRAWARYEFARSDDMPDMPEARAEAAQARSEACLTLQWGVNKLKEHSMIHRMLIAIYMDNGEIADSSLRSSAYRGRIKMRQHFEATSHAGED